MQFRWLVLSFVALVSGCAPFRFASYAVHPDFPRFEAGEQVSLSGLGAAVAVTQREDGLWKIAAPDEADAMRVEGYLVARDRMFQLDLFRHMARGELAALVGDRKLGPKSALEADILNRFLGFHRDARILLERTSAHERDMLQAYVDGINAWLATGHIALEHRLLGIDHIRPWEPVDSLAIYFMLMHSLSSNADREIRRLVIACEAGLDAMENVFPTAVEFGSYALPEEDFGLTRYRISPAVVAEMRSELPKLCPARSTLSRGATGKSSVESASASPLALLAGDVSLSTSNNWVTTGPLSQSGFPLLSGDPHLPFMNPPIVWGVDIETPDNHVVGFTIPGLHRVVFGHNFHVAWSATTNHVDRQDLVVHRGRSRAGGAVDGYEVDGRVVPFEVRTEHFEVHGGGARDVSVRFTKDGPLLNDIEPQLASKIPLTALRVASMGEGRDLDGARAVNYARNADEFSEGIERYDLGCSNWVFGDSAGSFGYRSPCRVPIRRGWQGAFPIPGWLSRYDWSGYVPKAKLPSSTNPRRGWLVTANSQMIPSDHFFTTYNNDAQAPNRYRRISERIASGVISGITRDSSAAIQLDLAHQQWPTIRRELASNFCRGSAPGMSADDNALRERLCRWDGSFGPASTEATVFELWTNAILDHALADALPDGAEGETWRYVQSLPQFEAVVQWLWTRTETDSIWDDRRTAGQERRNDILIAAFRDAAAEGRRRFGADSTQWHWGQVRPFVLRHPFAGSDGPLGELVNSNPLAIGGDAETVYKQQFVHSDREHMTPSVGPVFRFTVDMADPGSATYTLAGGESGWPRSPHYGDLLVDWSLGRGRPLTPAASTSDAVIRFVP